MLVSIEAPTTRDRVTARTLRSENRSSATPGLLDLGQC